MVAFGSTILDHTLMDKTKEQLQHSRPIDVHVWSDHPEAHRFVDEIWLKDFSSVFDFTGVGKRPRASPKSQLKVLLLDLYVAWLTDPDLLIAIGKSQRYYKAKSRYNELHISYVIVQVLNHAIDCGYIEEKLGYQLDTGFGHVTRIWPTSKLIKYFQGSNFSLVDIKHNPEREVIILNPSKIKASTDEVTLVDAKLESEEAIRRSSRKPVEYDDDDYVQIPEMRRNLRAYNGLLDNTFVDICSLDEPEVLIEIIKKGVKTIQRVSIGQHNKFVRRIFYRADWSLGGRFHGGWWQQVGSGYRKDIFINDKPTIEQDYSGLHVSLAYGLEKIQPPSDPYVVEQVFDLDAMFQRDVIKQLVLTAINAKTLKATFSAFRSSQKKGSPPKKYKDKQLQVLLDAFIESNQSIRGYLCSDFGVKLMAIDGRITNRIINHFTAQGIPILSVHDSYITQDEYTEELNGVMNDAIAEEIGFRVNIKSEGISYNHYLHFRGQGGSNYNDYHDMLSSIPKHELTKGYKERLDQFKLKLENANN